MPEYHDLIDPHELERIPVRFKHFLFRETPPSGATQSISFYAYGYTRAFEEMVTVALRRWPNGDYMRMALFYLARHSLELHLKETIQVFAAGAPIDLAGHGLAQLWDKMLRMIAAEDFPVDDDYAKHCGQLINHLHQADPTGERFRYPSDTSGTEFGYTRVELEGLVQAHYHITTYCEGSIEMLHLRWDD